MPRPKPKEGENQFVSRYMASAHARKKYPQESQRARVAHEIWRNRHKKKK